MARGAFPDSHPQHLGMPGHARHGRPRSAALQQSDLIIALGARFDDRVTGKLDSFAPGALVIHADIDPAEIGKNREADVPIVGDCREVIADLIDGAAHRGGRRAQPATTRAWSDSSTALRDTLPAGLRRRPTTAALARSTSSSGSARIAGPEAIYCAGVGQHQMWAAQFIKYEQPGHLDQLRRPRHDGLRRAGRDGRQGRPPGRARCGRSTATAASR